MREIKQAYREWLEAKDKAARALELEGDFDLAGKLDACRMFKGNESMSEAVDLIFTPQGVEFVTRYGFPGIETMRKFKRHYPEWLGVYVDCGKLTLTDERKVLLAGNTTAWIKYSETQGNRLVLLHGAKAVVEASGYSVVKIDTDGTCEVEVVKNDHAKVLMR